MGRWITGTPLLLWIGVIMVIGLVSVSQRSPAWWPTRAVTPTASAPVSARVSIQAPAIVEAGDPVQIKVTVAADRFVANQPPVYLLLIGAYGTRIREAPVVNGSAAFVLEAAETRVAGALQLQARWAGRQAQSTLIIRPGAPVEPLLVLVGPRSIPADGEHATMVVTVPQDRFANGVADATQVTVQALHPAAATRTGEERGEHEVIEAPVQSLLTWTRVKSRTTAGPIYLAARVGNAHSVEQRVLAVPGPPTPFTIHAQPQQLTADGNQLITIATSRVVDRFGNQLLDGTAVTFVVEEEEGGQRTAPAQLIAGTATVQVQAPTRPGPMTVRAFILDQVSPSLRLDFRAGLALAPIAITVTVDSDAVQLRAGPLLGVLDQYIPDGTEAQFILQREDERPETLRINTAAGFATARVHRSHLVPGVYSVRVTVGAATGESRFRITAPP